MRVSLWWSVFALGACGSPLSRLPACDEDTCVDGSVAAPDVQKSPDAQEPPDAAIDALDAAPDRPVLGDSADVPSPEDRAVADVIDDRPVMDAPRDVPAPDAPADLPTVDARDVVEVDVRPDVPVVDVRPDVSAPDAPMGSCVSGASGTHVVRFRFTGSGGASSRASVSYELNTLPDRARWRVTPNNRSIGYTPVYTDIFLGEGGLDLSGTGFIDVELSTAGLGSVSAVSLAIYGRSFNTTASGSFAWQTFDGIGAAPSGLVSNVAPYRWYRADATMALPAGNGSVLLRITPGPPSSSLIVNRVELCFAAR